MSGRGRPTGYTGGLRPEPDGGPYRILLEGPPARASRPALFLDRDGVLNSRVLGGYVTDPDDLKILGVAIEAARRARAAGAAVIVVSNQGCIARGLATPGQVLAVQAALVDRLAEREVKLDGIYWCPHHPLAVEGGEPCTCRKPEPGMFVLAAEELAVDLARSVMVGDQPTDHEAAGAAGIPGRSQITVSESSPPAEVAGLVMGALAP